MDTAQGVAHTLTIMSAVDGAASRSAERAAAAAETSTCAGAKMAHIRHGV